jgi:hypothetical protein
MPGRFSAWTTTPWVDTLQYADLWLGLCWTNPLVAADPLTAEVPVDRELGVWVRSSPTVLTLDSALVWRNLLPGTVVASVAGWDAERGGHLRFADTLSVPLTYVAGGTHTMGRGQFVLSVDIDKQAAGTPGLTIYPGA